MYASMEPAFRNEEAAYRFFEARIWPNGPVCPRCGGGDCVGRLLGKHPKPGTYKCYACRKPFNVKTGTILQGTHVPLHLWLQAILLLYLQPVSVNRLHQVLGVSSRTSWLMAQRLRSRVAIGECEFLLSPGVAGTDRQETLRGQQAGRTIQSASPAGLMPEQKLGARPL